MELNGDAKHSVPEDAAADVIPPPPNHFERQSNISSCTAPCIPPPLQSLRSCPPDSAEYRIIEEKRTAWNAVVACSFNIFGCGGGGAEEL